jgi:hypothetical protein
MPSWLKKKNSEIAPLQFKDREQADERCRRHQEDDHSLSR